MLLLRLHVARLRFHFVLVVASLTSSLCLTGCGNASSATDTVAPRLGDGSVVDWWFTYKFNTYSFPECSTTRECIFGGTVKEYKYGYGMQYLLASNVNGTTKKGALRTDCLGTGADPVAKTFDQIYSGNAPNYIIWNDQFYREPQIELTPACSTYSSEPTSCSAPWGHSKGAMAWDENGDGFIMQVTTPDWPGSGDSSIPRPTQGNTLGCIEDDNVEVAQHLFSLKLSPADTEDVLKALHRASVVTDPSNAQLVKLTTGPSNLAALAKGLGTLDTSASPYQASLSSGAKVIAKPQALHVPSWQMVSALVGKPLRTATWWQSPEILSAEAGIPGCWSSDLDTPQEVQIATSGQWQNTTFGLTGGLGQNYNHAKLGHSINGTLAIMGDMNQMGSYTPDLRKCDSSQNARGGLFFVLDDPTLHSDLKELMTGTTADYYNKTNGTTNITCGGAGISASSCRSTSKAEAGCTYVYSANAAACDVSKYGCYNNTELPADCPDKKSSRTFVV